MVERYWGVWRVGVGRSVPVGLSRYRTAINCSILSFKLWYWLLYINNTKTCVTRQSRPVQPVLDITIWKKYSFWKYFISPVSSSELGHCIVLKLNVALLDEIGELSFREICTTEKWSLEKLYFLYFFLNCFN